jgi:hypothetical protein
VAARAMVLVDESVFVEVRVGCDAHQLSPI